MNHASLPIQHWYCKSHEPRRSSFNCKCEKLMHTRILVRFDFWVSTTQWLRLLQSLVTGCTLTTAATSNEPEKNYMWLVGIDLARIWDICFCRTLSQKTLWPSEIQAVVKLTLLTNHLFSGLVPSDSSSLIFFPWNIPSHSSFWTPKFTIDGYPPKSPRNGPGMLSCEPSGHWTNHLFSATTLILIRGEAEHLQSLSTQKQHKSSQIPHLLVAAPSDQPSLLDRKTSLTSNSSMSKSYTEVQVKSRLQWPFDVEQ